MTDSWALVVELCGGAAVPCDGDPGRRLRWLCSGQAASGVLIFIFTEAKNIVKMLISSDEILQELMPWSASRVVS